MKTKHINSPKEVQPLKEENVYLASPENSDTYIPVNLNGPINIKRAIELENFKINNEEVFDRLSKTELKVFRAVAQGNNQKEVAEQLYISPNTVRTHINNIYRKLEISRFSDLLLFARAFDIL